MDGHADVSLMPMVVCPGVITNSGASSVVKCSPQWAQQPRWLLILHIHGRGPFPNEWASSHFLVQSIGILQNSVKSGQVFVGHVQNR